MNKTLAHTALYPGTFDPPTFGHLDIIERASKLFNKLIVAIGRNPAKTGFIPPNRRQELLQFLCNKFGNVEVRCYDGLTVDFAVAVGADLLIRGVRDARDLSVEMQLATTNRAVTGIETLLLPPNPVTMAVSSSLIKQIAAAGGDISAFTPPEVQAAIQAALSRG